MRGQSEDDADDELLSVAVMKGDKKLLAGTQSGVINLYSWGHIDDCSDRFPGTLSPSPPQSTADCAILQTLFAALQWLCSSIDQKQRGLLSCLPQR